MCDVFLCVFLPFPYCVPGQVQYLIVSIPDLCHLSYFCQELLHEVAFSQAKFFFVFGPCYVMQRLLPFVDLQSSCRGRESRLLYLMLFLLIFSNPLA